MSEKTPFLGIERLYGARAQKQLQGSTVMVIGLGGVGSWAAEALARSGVGHLILVDMDDICVSNINRQIHADTHTIGAMKIVEMKKRITAISPETKVTLIEDFFSASSAEEILAIQNDYIIDAIDGVKSKALLIARCKELGLPLVVTGGAGGKMDPTKIQQADLNRSYNCNLLAQVRKKLKREHGFSRDKKRTYKIPCIFSPEDQIMPQGENCDISPETVKRLNCQNGYGSSVFVTGAFGFHAAAKVVNDLTQKAN